MISIRSCITVTVHSGSREKPRAVESSRPARRAKPESDESRRPVVAGSVSLNGEDLHRNFDAFKCDIAYVPQRDILHDLLPVRQSVKLLKDFRPQDRFGTGLIGA